MKIITYTDGGSRGNPGPSAIGGVVMDANRKVLHEVSQYIGERTNNQAEYLALLETLKQAFKHKPTEIECFLDSELIVKQMKGIYKIKDAYLYEISQEIRKIIKGTPISFTHVMREYNKYADRLVNLALDHRTSF